ncbi:unnamed protein product [Enterobius vermicularis]|uniref:H/ACA ribonucleoprotein complex subunit n=1 Tax=Enterobius vermicularis TaxID=51028 RepID=A0A3P6H3E2_ENTVE|nr:unnamed protein product [Enterobius vermicularis]
MRIEQGQEFASFYFSPPIFVECVQTTARLRVFIRLELIFNFRLTMGFGRGGGGRKFGGRGSGGRGGYRGGFDQGPPSEVTGFLNVLSCMDKEFSELAVFSHTCEDDIVCEVTAGKIPYFNAPVYFENKEQIGKVDEIFGGIKDTGISVKLATDVKASSFKEGQKLFIDPGKLLPVERFLPGAAGGRGRGRGGGANRGNRGCF